MKKFDLEQAKAGKPVCTRDGRDVEIIKYDFKGDKYPIVSVVDNGDCDDSLQVFTKKGCWSSLGEQENVSDLFMKSEKKEGWINIYTGMVCSDIYATQEIALSCSDNEDYIATAKTEWEE